MGVTQGAALRGARVTASRQAGNLGSLLAGLGIHATTGVDDEARVTLRLHAVDVVKLIDEIEEPNRPECDGSCMI